MKENINYIKKIENAMQFYYNCIHENFINYWAMLFVGETVSVRNYIIISLNHILDKINEIMNMTFYKYPKNII